MATYVYETIPERDGEAPRRFELVQSMKDAPLTRDPQTGARVRRVISGGFGLMGVSSEKKSVSAPSSTPPCGAGCACHSGPRIPTP